MLRLHVENVTQVKDEKVLLAGSNFCFKWRSASTNRKEKKKTFVSFPTTTSLVRTKWKRKLPLKVHQSVGSFTRLDREHIELEYNSWHPVHGVSCMRDIIMGSGGGGKKRIGPFSFHLDETSFKLMNFVPSCHAGLSTWQYILIFLFFDVVVVTRLWGWSLSLSFLFSFTTLRDVVNYSAANVNSMESLTGYIMVFSEVDRSTQKHSSEKKTHNYVEFVPLGDNR